MVATATNSAERQLVEGGLWLGSMFAAADPAALDRDHITDIVCAIGGEGAERQVAALRAARFNVLHVPAEDRPDFDLSAHFLEVYRFIARRQHDEFERNVLVFCSAGVSRSATLVAAHLMASHQWSRAQAVAHLQAVRPLVQPNRGFLAQLDTWAGTMERELYGPNPVLCVRHGSPRCAEPDGTCRNDRL